MQPSVAPPPVRPGFPAALDLVVHGGGAGADRAARLRLLNFPLERDEGEYAYAGQLMLQGIPPYQLAYNMKFPGTYAAYAASWGCLARRSARLQRYPLGVLCMTTLTALMLFWLGKQILDGRREWSRHFYAVMAAALRCWDWLDTPPISRLSLPPRFVCDVENATKRTGLMVMTADCFSAQPF